MSLHEGWLIKQSKWVKAWRRRYCFLTDCSFLISKTPNEEKAHFHISLVSLAKIIERKDINIFQLRLKNGDIYSFRTANNIDWENWIMILKKNKESPPKRITMKGLFSPQLRLCTIDENHFMYLVEGFGGIRTRVTITDLTKAQRLVLYEPSNVGIFFTANYKMIKGSFDEIEKFYICIIHEDSTGNIAKKVLIDEKGVIIEVPTRAMSADSDETDKERESSLENNSNNNNNTNNNNKSERRIIQYPLLFRYRGYKAIGKIYQTIHKKDSPTFLQFSSLSTDYQHIVTCHNSSNYPEFKIWDVNSKQYIKHLQLDNNMNEIGEMLVLNDNTVIITRKEKPHIPSSSVFRKRNSSASNGNENKDGLWYFMKIDLNVENKHFLGVYLKFPTFPQSPSGFYAIKDLVRINDNLFASLCSDKEDCRTNKLLIWNGNTMELEGRISNFQNEFFCHTVITLSRESIGRWDSPSDIRLVTGGEKEIIWWDLDTKQSTLRKSISDEDQRNLPCCTAEIMVNSDSFIIIKDNQMHIHALSKDNGDMIYSFSISSIGLLTTLFSFDDSYIIITDHYHTCTIWNLKRGIEVQRLNPLCGVCDQLILLPDKRLLIPNEFTTDADFTIYG
jgi:hypothetical protein